MKRAVEQLQREGGIGHVTVVAATADMPPGLRYLVGGRRGRFVLVSLLWMGGWMYLYLYIYTSTDRPYFFLLSLSYRPHLPAVPSPSTGRTKAGAHSSCSTTSRGTPRW